VAPNEFREAIPLAPALSDDRKPVEVAPHVFGEEIGRAVSTSGLFSESLRDDGVEVSTKDPLEAVRRGSTSIRDIDRVDSLGATA
jgi:hypothetical protein